MAIQPLPVDAADGETVVDETYLNTNWAKVNANFAEVASGGATAEQAEWTVPAGASAADINAKILARWSAGGGKVWLSGTQYNVSEPVRVRPMSTHSGTAQSGSTSTTIKLATTAATNDFDYLQALVKITSGTGSGQSRVISAFNNSTKVATVTVAWGTTPDNTSVYTVQYWSSAQWMVDLVGSSTHGTKIVAASGFADGTFDGKECVVRLEGGISDRSGMVSEMTIDGNGQADYTLYVAATVERTLEKLNLQGAVIAPLVVDAAQNLKFAETRCMGGQYSKLIMNGAASLNFDRCEFTNATVDTVWSGADSSFRGYGWYPGVTYPLMNKYDTCLFEIAPAGTSTMVPLRILAGVGIVFDNCTFATQYYTGTKSVGCVVLGDGTGAHPVEDIHFKDCQFYRGGDTSSGDYILVNDEVLGTVVEDCRWTGGYSGGNVAIRAAVAPVTVRGWTFRDSAKTFVGNIHAQPGRTSWTTSGRPVSVGAIPPGLNTTTGRFESFDGAGWQNLVTDEDLVGIGAGATPWFVPVPDTDPQQYQATGPDGPIGDPIELEVVQSDLVKNPKGFGAEGDGTTDDTAAVQAAVDDLPDGGELYFPAGTYALGDSITVTTPLLIRCDPGVVVKMTALVPALTVSGTSDVSVEGLTFDGDRDTLGPGVYDLIELEDVSRVRIRDCKFLDSSSGGIKITRGASIWITDNYFSNLFNAGVGLRDPGSGHYNEDIWITDNYFDKAQQGGFDGNAAIESNHTSELSYRYIHVHNNIVHRPEIVGIGLDSLSMSTIRGNIIIKDGTCSPGEALGFTGSDNVVSDNYCHNDSSSSGGALLFWGVSDIPCEHNQIVNNRCTSGGQGIAIVFSQNGTDINNLLIQGNHCYGNDYGIQSWLQPGVTTGSQTGVVVSGNDLTGNTTAALSLIPVSGGITGEPPVVFANHGAWSTRRVGTITASATPAVNTDKYDQVNMYSLATAVTSMTTNLTGTPRDGQELTIIFNDSGSPHAITWGSMFVGNLLQTTNGSGLLHVQELKYDAVVSKWAGTYVDPVGYNGSSGTNANINLVTTGKVLANGVPVATIRESPVTVSGTSKTLALTDAGTTQHCTNGSATTITVPANSSVAFTVGDTITIRQYGAGQVTIAPAGGVTINPSSTLKISARYKTAVLTKIGTDEWHIDGSLTA